MSRTHQQRPPPRFTSTLPLLLSRQTKLKRIAWKIYRYLPTDQRQSFRRYPGNGNDYYMIVKIPPYPNPFIEHLRRKLRSQRVKFTEIISGEFVVISTLQPLEE